MKDETILDFRLRIREQALASLSALLSIHNRQSESQSQADFSTESVEKPVEKTGFGVTSS
jgi:hypothetical protein